MICTTPSIRSYYPTDLYASYIVDFEYYANADFEEIKIEFSGHEYECWKLAESCFLGWD
jgi:hypothetical protein